MPRNFVAELRDLQERLRQAHERAAVALRADLSGYEPGEALRRFLAAEAEVDALVRELRELQASNEQGGDPA